MGSDDDRDNGKVAKLSRENHEVWFQEMEDKLEGKRLFYVIEKSMYENAWIKRAEDTNAKTPDTDNSASEKSNKTLDKATKDTIDDITSAFAQMGGSWNIDKREKFKADQAQAFFYIGKGLDIDDKTARGEYQSDAKGFWEYLKSKYEKTSQATAHLYMTKLQTFQLDESKGLDHAWIKLKQYRRKAIAADSNLKNTYSDNALFLILTRALPDSYKPITRGFITQPNLGIEEKLKMLTEIEEENKEYAKQPQLACPAFRYRHPNHSSRQRNNSDISMAEAPDNQVECFYCRGDHFARDCEFQEQVRDFGEKLRRNKDRKARKPSSRATKPKLAKPTKLPAKRQSSKPKKKHGYAARYSDSESASESETSLSGEEDTDDEDSPAKEAVHLSRALISKSTPSQWILDTGCTTPMTDQLHLFRGPLKDIKRTTIQVGGGEIYTCQRGTVEVRCKDRSSALVKNTFYVPKLGVNLLSAKRLCKNGMKGSFDHHNIWIKSGDKTMIHAAQKDGLYIVKHLSKQFKGKALVARKPRAQAHPTQDEAMLSESEQDANAHAEENNSDPDESEAEEPTTKKERKTYRLMHRRWGHYGPEMLRKLHLVTKIKKIKIPPAGRRVCGPCKKGKMRNKISKILAKHKAEILALISWDIAGPFPMSLRRNKYLLELVDNYSRKIWSIPIKTKDQAIPELESWKAKVELQTGKKVKAARSDNAPELKQIMNQWEREGGVQAEYTTIASSNQNGPAERAIQTSENGIRTLLDDAELPIEFWDEAAEADAYLRNRLPRGPVIKGKITSPEQAFTGEMPRHEHIRAWGSKSYDYVNPKTLPKEARHDKLMLRGREGVFMGYSETTEKQFKVYAPDLGYTRRTSALYVDEAVKGGTVDLRFRNHPSGSQGTPNQLPDRNPRGRPKKADENRPNNMSAPKLNDIVVAPPSNSILRSTTVLDEETIDVEVPEQQTPTPAPAADVPSADVPKRGRGRPKGSKNKERKISSENKEVDEEDIALETPQQSQKLSAADETEVHKNNQDSNTSARGEQMDIDTDERPTQRRYFNTRSEKRKRDTESAPDLEEERTAKMVKAMLAMLTNAEDNQDQHEHSHVASAPAQACHEHSEAEVDIITYALLAILTKETQDDAEAALPASEINGISIPRTYKEAINDKRYGPKWKQAVIEEIKSLIANGTWEEYVLPKGANLVSTKWVFAIKLNPDGSIERFKARLVARGFSQQHGIDYNETFAPTVRMDSLRLFLAMVAKNDFECHHFDIKNAYTESKLKEQIFLAPPQGVAVKKGKVLHALRSLYGLKQAGRDWNLLLKKFLLEKGFVQSLADPCLYVHPTNRIWLLVYVDDILAAAEKMTKIDWFYEVLSSRFNAKNLGEVNMILGARVTRDRKNKTIYLDQENYLNATLNLFGIPKGKYKAKDTPAADYTNLRPATDKDERIDTSQYQQGVGKLMYAMILTRPDIAFVLGRLAQYMTDPAIHHGQALKNLMRYLRSTIKQKIRFGPGGAHENEFVVYTDADWASDKADRKSISGGVGMFYGGVYSWASKKQNSVSTATAEAEYISQAMYAKQGQWTAQIFRDLGMPECINTNGQTVQMFGDNQGAIALTKNPHITERSKHIDVCYHFIRDLAERQKLEITYIPTDRMVADGMTKPLARVAFERFKKQMGIVDEARVYK